MPELPEVETVKNALIPHLVGRLVRSLTVVGKPLREPHDPHHLTARIIGQRISQVDRVGRYILIRLKNLDDVVLLSHLGMTGCLHVDPTHLPLRKHDHIAIGLDAELELRYEDPRRFGMLQVVKAVKGFPQRLLGIGPEPLSDDFTGAVLLQAIKTRKQAIKPVLMDNAVVTGVGNIYVTEALFCAGVHPETPALTITKKQAEKLVLAIKSLLRAAIAAGGTTISDFRAPDGSEGKFALSLQVYGKSGTPCSQCGHTLEHLRQAGRTSVFCPHCQPRKN